MSERGREGVRTGKGQRRGAWTAARRRVMGGLRWFLLAAAVGLAAAWVGGVAGAGEWTHFYWSKWYTWESEFDSRLLTIEGWNGGIEVRHQSAFSVPTLFYNDGWMWKPTFERFPGGWSLCVPHWIPAGLLGGAAGGLFWRERRARRRARVGCCAACGYDRAGLAAGAVCPECGKA